MGTKMIISLVCCFLMFAVTVCSSVQYEPNASFCPKCATDNRVIPSRGRWKRSLYSLGLKALQYVTTGATKLFATEFGEVFVKRGGFHQAMKDFDVIVDSAKVQNTIRNGVTVKKVGVVGDRAVIYDRGNAVYPPKLTLLTSKTPPKTKKGFEKDIIIYKDGKL